MKYIIVDLDDTLLTSDKTISEYSVDVFKRCREAGHYIVFATARAENGMVRFIERINPNAIISVLYGISFIFLIAFNVLILYVFIFMYLFY